MGLTEVSPAPAQPAALSEDQAELKRLRKKVAELEQVNLLLKSAAAFFSQDHLKKNISS